MGATLDLEYNVFIRRISLSLIRSTSNFPAYFYSKWGFLYNLNFCNMCLVTRFPFIKTKKPIFCYKVVNEDYKSQYQNFPYELNKLCTLHSNLVAASEVTVISGIFPERLEDEYPYIITELTLKLLSSKFPHLKVINHWFHAYRTLDCARDYAKFFKLIVVKCVIPEGSTIGINYDEIVSNQIVIIEQVKYE